ncbi:DUF1640 domain-containing protein [Rhodoblastus acidophilus]|nr:DUF1640 domain-containing protein [Rhodoblastus acidophilus]RAI16421.1 DUF1640 domain-containing protein [Rhodoblastus acidophilus]
MKFRTSEAAQFGHPSNLKRRGQMPSSPTYDRITPMVAQVLFNPLPYIDRLTRGGFTPDQARAHAEALETAFAESVATKRDLTDVKNELQREISDFKNELQQEIVAVKHELKQDIAGVRQEIAGVKHELKQDIAGVRQEISSVRQEIAAVKNDVLRWTFGFNLVMLGAIFTMLKFLH